MKVKITGAGRTDKGVHAFGQHANFKINKKIENEKKFLNSLNFFLGKNLISIISIKRKKSIFHSRFDAKERIYEYKIINREGSLSIYNSKAWHVKKKLNISLLKKGAKTFRGYSRLLNIQSFILLSEITNKENAFCEGKKKRRSNFFDFQIKIFFTKSGKINGRIFKIFVFR